MSVIKWLTSAWLLFVSLLQDPQEYVKAVADYVTRESTLLSFRKGDVIRIVNNEQYIDKGIVCVCVCVCVCGDVISSANPNEGWCTFCCIS